MAGAEDKGKAIVKQAFIDALNEMEQPIISKELIKLKEQTEKMMNSEIMQKRIQTDRAILEANEKYLKNH